MDYRKLAWVGDVMSTELYADDDMEEYTIGIYRIKDFPDVILHIATETEVIVGAHVMNEFD